MLEPISWEEFIKISSPQYYVLLVTSAEGRTNLTGISWFSLVSWTPPLVMLSVRSSRFGYKLLRQNPEFVVALPSADQQAAAAMCGRKSGSRTDKVKEGGFTFQPATKISAPLLAEATACLECRIKNEIEVGDHQLILAEVLACYGDWERSAHVYTTSYERFYSLNHERKND